MCPQCGDPVGIPLHSVEPDFGVTSALDPPSQSASATQPTREDLAADHSATSRKSSDQDQANDFGTDSRNGEIRAATPDPPRPLPRPRQPQASSGPRPYFDPDGQVAPVRRIKRKQKPKNRADDPTTPEIINASDEVGIQLRSKPHWYRLLGRSKSTRSFEFEIGYTIGNVPIVFGHMLLHAVCACVLLEWLPLAMQSSESQDWMPVVLTSLVWFVVAAYTISLLSQILAHSAKGVVDEINRDPWVALKHIGRWIVIAICGPAILLGGAAWFWVNCGEVTTLDWVVLVELIIAAFAYFLVGGTTSLAMGRLRGALPGSVLGTIAAMPMTVLLSTLLFLAGGCSAAWLIKSAAEGIHAELDAGYFLVALAFIIMGFVGLGLARWLGSAFFAHRMESVVEQATTTTIVPKDMTDFAELAQHAGRSVK